MIFSEKLNDWTIHTGVQHTRYRQVLEYWQYTVPRQCNNKQTKTTGKKTMQPKMQVTVLSGFLGAGKTTLLKKILRENNKRADGEKLSIAVIVNDMGEINLDASEIKNSKLIQEEAEMVELHNGCICCTLRGDLLKTVKSLAEEKSFDYLVIESTGISEPLPVAQTFVMDVDDYSNTKLNVAETQPSSLSHYATLDTMISVVDALNIFDILSSIETLAEENSVGMVGNTGLSKDTLPSTNENHDHHQHEEDESKKEEEEEDDRSLAQLMLDQIEFANVIVISKVQILLKKEQSGTKKLEEIKALLHKLNPTARILAPLEDNYGDLDVEKELLQTGLFNMEEASKSAGWMQELAKEEHAPETEEYGISSTIFRSNKMPFHPVRLDAMLNGFGNYESALEASKGVGGGGGGGSSTSGVFKGVVRSKGHVWLATAYAFPLTFHTAGKHLSIEPAGIPFLAAMKEDDWDEDDRAHHEDMVEKKLWSKEFGDRHSEIVFIGVNLNKKLILDMLNNALLTEEESKGMGGINGWRKLEDPFFDGKTAETLFDLEYDDEEDESCPLVAPSSDKKRKSVAEDGSVVVEVLNKRTKVGE